MDKLKQTYELIKKIEKLDDDFDGGFCYQCMYDFEKEDYYFWFSGGIATRDPIYKSDFVYMEEAIKLLDY